MFHKWYKGAQEQYGNYIYRDDICRCGCVRRTVLNDQNREEIESYTINDLATTIEPQCQRKKTHTYTTRKKMGLVASPTL